jgi:hypothetical protein
MFAASAPSGLAYSATTVSYARKMFADLAAYEFIFLLLPSLHFAQMLKINRPLTD